jgi:hypothetical protein
MLPQPYLGVAVAFPDPDDEGLLASMILLHGGEEVAARNAGALGDVLAEGEMLGSDRPWSDIVTDVEVSRSSRAAADATSPVRPAGRGCKIA